ncbi:ATP-binding protein [Frigidibacter sp. MR17.14]|uniref:sensor histidine kinase n=1 Tax=Frigidibacter sp. MR17.14 TaxID=3126509 RepID=UPI003012BC30
MPSDADSHRPSSRRLPPRRRFVLRLGLCLAALVLLGAVFAAARGQALVRLGAQTEAAARIRALALDSILAKQRAVAAILADDREVIAALGARETGAAVSRKLERVQAETQSTVIYLLDDQGRAISASNFDEPGSFVGQDYSFRDYFRAAMTSGTALQFALGTVSNRPGLYLSHDVRDGSGAIGVVVVKVEFDAVEAAWAASRDRTRVTDMGGTVLLSSRPSERFAPMPASQGDHLSVAVPVEGADWRLVQEVSGAPALETAALTTGGVGLALGLGALGIGQASRARRRAERRQAAERQYRDDLERAVAERTEALSAEMHERRAAERRLAELQADLVQANKLAALGQTAAGVAHEVNQPLATIRVLAETGLDVLGDEGDPEVSGNLATIVRMTSRIAQITTELRNFARKATGEITQVSLAEAVKASLLLTESRRRSGDIPLELAPIDPGLRVMAETVRLEQVLVNLLQNAEEAQGGQPRPWIRLGVEAGDDAVTVTLADNGPGLDPAQAERLFTPFATTKPGGLGLGLVIAREIAREFGGDLRADPPVPGQGAVFRLTLRRAP